MVFYKGSNYDYHFIIKELAKESEEVFMCLGDNTEKYKLYKYKYLFSSDNKEVKRTGDKIAKAIFYRLQFTDRARFMVSSLSIFDDNLAEGTYKIKCKYGHDNKECKTFGIKYNDWQCCLEYTNVKII